MKKQPFGIKVQIPAIPSGTFYMITPCITIVSERGPRTRRIALVFGVAEARQLETLLPGSAHTKPVRVFDIDGNHWLCSAAPCGQRCYCAISAEAID